MRNIISLAPYVLFFLMLFVPITYAEIKIPLILVTLFIIFQGIQSKQNLSISRPIMIWFLIQICSGVFFVTLGWINNTPGAIRVSTVVVFWPILYALFISGISDVRRLTYLINTLLVASFAIPIYTLLFILSSSGIIPNYFYIEIDQGQILGVHQDHIAYSLYSISSLVFLTPYLISKHFISSHSNKILTLIGLFLCIIALLISGRRGFFLSILIGVFVHVLFTGIANGLRASRLFQWKNTFNISMLVLGTLAAFYILQDTFGFGIDSIAGILQSAGDFDNNESNFTRKTQYDALMQGWFNSPIIGAGYGASAEKYGSLRGGDEQPWAYELSYVALLYQTGIIGSMIWWLSLLWIFIEGGKLIREKSPFSNDMINVFSGMAGFLAANASNPYLGKYDHMWVLYLPLGIINLHMMSKQIHKLAD